MQNSFAFGNAPAGGAAGGLRRRLRPPGRLLHRPGPGVQPRLEGICDHSNGTYPNEYTRYYARQFQEDQNADSIDALTGATSSHSSFQLLSEAVLEQARQGDSSVRVVDTSKE